MQPVPLASGRDADVHALNAHRVLRRYRDGGDATAEAALMTYLAGRGFPVPEVYDADGPDLVLQRLTGPTLLDALRTGAVGVSGGAAVLADLHDRLHAEPARAATDPAARIVHLDIHPANVLLHHGQAMLIDWRNATEAVPSLDTAVTGLILALAARTAGDSVAGLAEELLPEFAAAVAHAPELSLPDAVALRRMDPALTRAEVALLDAAAADVQAYCRRR